jgi:hypothetical protein
MHTSGKALAPVGQQSALAGEDAVITGFRKSPATPRQKIQVLSSAKQATSLGYEITPPFTSQNVYSSIPRQNRDRPLSLLFPLLKTKNVAPFCCLLPEVWFSTIYLTCNNKA